ncbi:MAG: hypothetical protein COU25_01510 [Candidatus Levybacteria bacterium CG10_big_fil_rev_8_21_14_0_10_35_13]|nr:MAG: hypothetical protein COU25_01510 [Candidatus Levybacteria bacterium CG10_big_fil_rev_8_21_14_0_10_35_13]
MTVDAGKEVNKNSPTGKDTNPSAVKPSDEERRYNRIRRGVWATAALALALAAPKIITDPEQQSDPQVYPPGPNSGEVYQTHELPKIETNLVFDGQLNLGSMEDLSLKEPLGGNYWINDGHIPYFTTPEGTKRYFIVKGNTTVMLETNDETLEQAAKNKDFKQVKNVLYPSMAERSDGTYDTYTGITSILQLDKNNPMHLIGVGHFERRVPNAPIYAFTATVGKVESFDGGLTWKNFEPIITGDNPAKPGVRATGAGQPAAYYNEKDGFVYIMYTDWAAQDKVRHADQLYMARAKANSDGTLGNVEYLLDDDTFGDMIPGKLKSVIPANSDYGYTALPSLSFNTKLNQYLTVFETMKGFYATTSADLINWDPKPKEVLDLAKNSLGNYNSNAFASAGYVTYPTFLSDGSYPNDQTTGTSGTLYFAFEPNFDTPNDLVGVDFNFVNPTEQKSAQPSTVPTETTLDPAPTLTPMPEATQELSYDHNIPNVYNGNLNVLKSAAATNPDSIVTKNEKGEAVLTREYIEDVKPGERVAIEGDVVVSVDGKLVNNFDNDGTTGAITYVSVPQDRETVTVYLVYGGRVHRISSSTTDEEARKLVDEYINSMNETYNGKVTEYDIK